MLLTTYLVLIWFIIGLFILEKKALKNTEIAFLLLFVVTVNTHFWLIIAEPLEMLKISNDSIKYITFVLYRSILTPLIVPYTMNKVLTKEKQVGKYLYLFIGLSFLWMLEYFNQQQKVTDYLTWSLMHTFVYLLILFLLSFLFTYFSKKRRWA